MGVGPYLMYENCCIVCVERVTLGGGLYGLCLI